LLLSWFGIREREISEEREGQYNNPGYLLTPCSRALVLGSMLHPGGKCFFFWGKERYKGVRINLVKNERMEDGGGET
jgi:hypothetical protein